MGTVMEQLADRITQQATQEANTETATMFESLWRELNAKNLTYVVDAESDTYVRDMLGKVQELVRRSLIKRHEARIIQQLVKE